MILYIQAVLIMVLCAILGALYIDEKHKRKIGIPTGKLTTLWDGSERRRYVRINTNVPIRYSRPKDSNNHVKAIKTKDISIGGICMIVNEKLSPSLRLCLEIEAPGLTSPISVKGMVVWVREGAGGTDSDGVRYFNIGIEFNDVMPKDKERLFNYIKQLDKK